MSVDYNNRPVVDAATLNHLDSAGRAAVCRTQDVVDRLRRGIAKLEQETVRSPDAMLIALLQDIAHEATAPLPRGAVLRRGQLERLIYAVARAAAHTDIEVGTAQDLVVEGYDRELDD